MGSFKKPEMLTYKAGSDLSAKQFHGVKFGSDDQTMVIGTAGDCDGVLMNCPEADQDAEVAHDGGGAKFKLADTVTRGDSLRCDSNGQWVAGAAGQLCHGIALESGVSGDVIGGLVHRHSIPA